MEKIAITPPYFYPGEGAAIAAALTERGFDRVHVRKPGCGHVEALKELLHEIPVELRAKVTLHDGHHLASTLGYGGVHLSARAPEAPQGWTGLVSRAVHDLNELDAPGADYQLLSPVYPSISKPGHNPAWSWEEMAAVVSRAGIPVIALGGVTPHRLPQLQEAGFAGGAMLTEAWSRSVPREEFRLQFITHGEGVEATVEGARKALDGGCRWVQLRMKDAPEEQLMEAGVRIAELCRKAGAVFIVDDFPHIAVALGADGVHLGKNDMPVEEARGIVGPGAIIGATANTLEDVRSAQLSGADYVGLGPFRFTTTKKRLSPVLGLDGYRSIMHHYHSLPQGRVLPVVAIGGITLADIPAVMECGVQGIALSGAILNAADPVGMTAQIVKQLSNTKIND